MLYRSNKDRRFDAEKRMLSNEISQPMPPKEHSLDPANLPQGEGGKGKEVPDAASKVDIASKSLEAVEPKAAKERAEKNAQAIKQKVNEAGKALSWEALGQIAAHSLKTVGEIAKPLASFVQETGKSSQREAFSSSGGSFEHEQEEFSSSGGSFGVEQGASSQSASMHAEAPAGPPEQSRQPEKLATTHGERLEQNLRRQMDILKDKNTDGLKKLTAALASLGTLSEMWKRMANGTLEDSLTKPNGEKKAPENTPEKQKETGTIKGRETKEANAENSEKQTRRNHLREEMKKKPNGYADLLKEKQDKLKTQHEEYDKQIGEATKSIDAMRKEKASLQGEADKIEDTLKDPKVSEDEKSTLTGQRDVLKAKIALGDKDISARIEFKQTLEGMRQASGSHLEADVKELEGMKKDADAFVKSGMDRIKTSREELMNVDKKFGVLFEAIQLSVDKNLDVRLSLDPSKAQAAQQILNEFAKQIGEAIPGIPAEGILFDSEEFNAWEEKIQKVVDKMKGSGEGKRVIDQKVQDMLDKLAPEQKKFISSLATESYRPNEREYEALVKLTSRFGPEMCQRLVKEESMTLGDLRAIADMLPQLDRDEMELFMLMPIFSETSLSPDIRKKFAAFDSLPRDQQVKLIMSLPIQTA